MTKKGLNTTGNASEEAAALKAAGYDFVGRYLGKTGWKLLSPTEAHALKAAGLSVVLVYDSNHSSAEDFQPGRGTADAHHAIAQAVSVMAPAGTAIYFTVDYNASEKDIRGPISDYFREVASVIASPGGTTPVYSVGIYGSGAVCAAMQEAGYAHYTWLAQPESWSGHTLPKPWNIRQGRQTTIGNLSAEEDAAFTQNIGAM